MYRVPHIPPPIQACCATCKKDSGHGRTYGRRRRRKSSLLFLDDDPQEEEANITSEANVTTTEANATTGANVTTEANVTTDVNGKRLLTISLERDEDLDDREKIIADASLHVKQASDQRRLCNAKIKEAEDDLAANKSHANSRRTIVCDYSQNGAVPSLNLYLPLVHSFLILVCLKEKPNNQE